MSNKARVPDADPHASLLEAFIASPHEWLALQRYCEASGRSYWEPGSGHEPAHPIDPLSELLLGLTVATLLEGDGEEPPPTEVGLDDLCDHTFINTAAWLRENDKDEVSVYQQLLERDMFCDHEVVEQLLVDAGATLSVLVEGWVAGGDSATVDRLVEGKIVEIAPKAADPDTLAEGPLAGVWRQDRLQLWRQLMGGMHLLGLLHDAMDYLREGERLVLAVAFPYEDGEPPTVAVAVPEDCWVLDVEARFSDDALEREDHHRLDKVLPDLRKYRPPPPRAGGKLPTEAQEDWVIEQLAALVQRQGTEQLLQPPVLNLPFKRGELSGEDGVRQVLRFIMNTVGLEPLALHLRLAPYADVLAAGGIAHPHADQTATLGWFEGIDGDRCIFGVDLSQHWDLEGLVGTLSHEVAHAWRHHHDLVVEDHLQEELLTDLTTHYLGFGVYTTNTSSRLRTWSDWSASDFTSYQQHEKAGYLPTVTMSFTLALTVAARGSERADRKRVARRLETDQKAFFKTALSYLEEADELVQSLGMGPRRRRAPMRERNVSRPGPFDPRDTVEVWEQTDADGPRADDAEPVFGIKDRQPTGITWLSVLVVIGASIGLGYGTGLFILAFLVGAVFSFLMYFFGPGTRCLVCTVCEAHMAEQDTTCPGCGGHVHGHVKDGYEWLEAKERLEGTYVEDDD